MNNSTFLTVLQSQRYGELMDEASEAITQVTEAVRRTGKAGSITIKLVMKPLAGAKVALVDKVVSVIPKEQPDFNTYFVGENNELSRNDPRQKEFELTAVDGGKKEESLPKPVAVARQVIQPVERQQAAS